MRVAESIILDALTRGGCIKTFYRISSRQAAESATRIPEGYILESPGEPEDIVLSHADFHALEKQLEQKETWEQVVGVTCFGGATWQLRAGSV
ncbi:TPA: cytoplasmic protein [Klebsiella pneumoniae]|nr:MULTISPECIES: cytoplasmic protein [Enterobacteriaceae]HBL8847072.1 cytoplasmic protein [Enterobacter hormaechei]HBQ3761184.1 cytoplasmic protein [Klebsiella quasipneumoniae subsp. similipneumoniae]HEP0322988.1 cytoplasmic protein [Klebsiella pneumoniae subsp. pneumoniae]MBF7780074.1 cytoplasmic protein [Klebsiella quasipneumoniae]MBL4376125.1 cytoplasmic protein [Klebsiella pneumoniae]